MLAANPVLLGSPTRRTRQGRSPGEFLLLADRLEEAVKSFEQERKEHGNDWKVSLSIGNCQSRMGAAKAAYSNYRRAFFLGLLANEYGRIEDPRFRQWLKEPDEDWPFAEVLLRREMPMGLCSTQERLIVGNECSQVFSQVQSGRQMDGHPDFGEMGDPGGWLCRGSQG